MKLNWGTGIAIVYGIFALSMIGVLIASRNHNPGLVDKDYYNLDINYQERLEKRQNAAAMAVQPTVQYDAVQKNVSIQFPDGMQPASGTAKFFRSETLGDDFTQKIEAAPNGRQTIGADKMHPGRWHVELDWEAGGKKYFVETTFIVTNA